MLGKLRLNATLYCPDAFEYSFGELQCLTATSDAALMDDAVSGLGYEPAQRVRLTLVNEMQELEGVELSL